MMLMYSSRELQIETERRWSVKQTSDVYQRRVSAMGRKEVRRIKLCAWVEAQRDKAWDKASNLQVRFESLAKLISD
jgi:hypothetical protein